MTFDLTSACLTWSEKHKLLAFLQKNRSIFANSLKELGCTHLYNHHIETVPGAKPFRSPPYRQTPKVRAEQDRQVKELLDSDIIEPSCSNWASPVVMCFKKSGEMRMAINYRKVNSLNIPQTFPLPHMESVFDAIGEVKAQYFSCVDLKSGFHQVPLTEESKHKSAFITQTGIYQFKRMPFGLMNSPITFQAMMSHVLRGLNWKFVLVYVDDILIFSQTFEDHLNHLS
ncbi:Transposon Ty3-I Gag-Pol polyprotein,Transposon Ty3-G Gag-Pol polyprotein [Mytilus coruscus]|uniref:Transposon Ty3-I Gag-Pol polyprotein,Transposon Ty3-G Gag-Pol polyprotein n=1 Tax=Mytilus coruscus TaxID=42192 RepID=A0A6J8BPF0_MYTCO|nr:Transposon Ty3-I Gag-Pol polyprotein,Transposon Ty3-G Gag-Pol polyprotein [Mytilus coruscus]